MIKTVNLEWVTGLAIFFTALLFSLLRSHARAFRLKIFLMAADLCGVTYFVFGKYVALGAAVTGLVFSFVSIHPRKH